MSKHDKSEDALKKAMEDALDSVERRQHAAHADAEPKVEVEFPGAAASAEAVANPTAAPPAEDREAALREQLLRLAADFDNFQKRARREKDEVRRFGTDRVLTDVLPVIDNLERALAHSDSHDTTPVIIGIRMVAKQFHDVLLTHGVKPYDCVGKAFDPEKHEAVSQQPSPDHAPGTILQELQRGYMIHDRLLRPARVVVTSAASTPSSPDTES